VAAQKLRRTSFQLYRSGLLLAGSAIVFLVRIGKLGAGEEIRKREPGRAASADSQSRESWIPTQDAIFSHKKTP
jgi:hypothetical protein